MDKRENKKFLNSMKKYHKKISQIYLQVFDNNDEFDMYNEVLNKEKLRTYDNNTKDVSDFKNNYCNRASFIVLNKIIFIRLLDIYKKNYTISNFKWCDKSYYIEKSILSKKLSILIFQNIEINNSYIKYIFKKNDFYELMNLKFNKIINCYNENKLKKNEKIIDEYKKIIRDIIKEVYNFNYFDDLKIIGHMYENIMNKKTKKSLGKFYTPDDIIDKVFTRDIYNIDIALNPYITIADICCGSGYFLSKAYDILKYKFINSIEILQRKFRNEYYVVSKDGKNIKINGIKYWTKSNIHYHIIKNCLYASDVDEFALQITFIILIFKDINCFVDEFNIVKSDSLIKWENFQELSIIKGILKFKGQLVEDIELKRNIEFWSKKFDVIIGNPPWVSLKRKQRQPISKEIYEYYSNMYHTSSYSPNLFEYFFKRSIEKVKDGGIISLVIPINFVDNIQYSRFRYDILSKCLLRSLIFNVNFPYIIIDGMIITIEKAGNLNNIVEIRTMNGEKGYVNQNVYLNNKNYEFIRRNGIINDIKEKILINSKILGEIGTTFTGFIGMCKDMTDKRIDDKQIAIYRGRNINRYVCNSNYYYEFCKDNIKGGTKDLKKLKNKEKILVRKTGNNLIAAYDNSGIIVEQSLYGIINLNRKFQYKYVLAILNSKLINWYYKNYLVTNKNSIPQIKKYNLNNIPIKICSESLQGEIVEIVEGLMFDLKCINSKKYYDKIMLEKSIENKIILLDNKMLDIYGIKDFNIRKYIKEYR